MRLGAPLCTLLAALAIGAVGCGDDSSGSDSGAVPAPTADEYSEDQVMQDAHLESNDGGISYTHTPSGCNLAVIPDRPRQR